jgi:hypothetical protein
MERDMLAQLATKSDVQHIQLLMRSDFEGFRKEMKAEIDGLRNATRADRALLPSKMTIRLGSLWSVGMSLMFAAHRLT